MKNTEKHGNAAEFTGTKRVFLFTFVQFFKNRANLFSFVLIFVMCIISGPLTSVMSGAEINGTSAGGYYDNIGSLPETIYIFNVTPLNIDSSNNVIKDSPFADCKFVNVNTQDISLDKDEMLVTFTFDNENLCYRFALYSSSDSVIDDGTAEGLNYAMYTAFESAKFDAAGLSGDTLTILSTGGYNSTVGSVSDFSEKDAIGYETRTTINFIYSVIILMLCTLASSYIIKTVVEEKASKLIEFLLVSVRPLALLTGKILAMMSGVLALLVTMVMGTMLSNYISTEYLGLPSMMDTLSATGFSLDLLNLDPVFIVTTIAFVIISYVAFSIISGIAGSCCNTMEESSTASLISIAPAMVGYMGIIIVTGFENAVLNNVFALLPVLGLFGAPALYLTGDISSAVMLTSMAIQIGSVFVLALFCRRIYSYVIMYKGTKLKLSNLFNIAKGGQLK